MNHVDVYECLWSLLLERLQWIFSRAYAAISFQERIG
jgi:hypothetical protein